MAPTAALRKVQKNRKKGSEGSRRLSVATGEPAALQEMRRALQEGVWCRTKKAPPVAAGLDASAALLGVRI